MVVSSVMDDNKSNHHIILKDAISALKNGNTVNVPGLLELLNISNDINVQVKIFSILSACLVLNDTIEAIITYHPIYDKICEVLANCPPRKTTVAFNFLSALFYVDEEDSPRKKCLVAYGKNMIRSSGCLAAMCDLFTSCMMHQDAWRALCRSLAEACRGAEANQSYCTHLVPMCVQRFSLRNIEVLLVLQSLLQNHSRNIDLFVECNGISLFQRSFLQHDVCMQLLATIAQSSIRAVALIVKTNICQLLRDFLDLYGPQSQLGQWATIVLYHTSRVEVSCEGRKDDQLKKVNDKLNESKHSHIDPVTQNCELQCSADTTKFFQSVMKEILQCGAQNEFKHIKAFYPTDIMENQNQKNLVNNAAGHPLHEITQQNKGLMSTRVVNKSHLKRIKTNAIETNELSFSFLRKLHLDDNDTNTTSKFVTTNTFPAICKERRTLQTDESYVRNNTVYASLIENKESCSSTVNTNDFKPNIASTPKKAGISQYSRYGNQFKNNITHRYVQRSIRNHQIKRRSVKNNIESSKIVKEIKHRSFSGRFFDVINTSCTTLVKTVKNIFRPKSNTDTHETKDDRSNKTSNQDTLSCSYSFTNYMRKRDAALNNECNNSNKSSEGLVDCKSKEIFEGGSLEMTNSCNTCNNTMSLKRKLANNDHLKRTIRKLKLGINLYGCDFKKISRAMWPNDSYLTPAVLYNLYRKLIIK